MKRSDLRRAYSLDAELDKVEKIIDMLLSPNACSHLSVTVHLPFDPRMITHSAQREVVVNLLNLERNRLRLELHNMGVSE